MAQVRRKISTIRKVCFIVCLFACLFVCFWGGCVEGWIFAEGIELD